MIIFPLFFVAKNHPGLSRRGGRKITLRRRRKDNSSGSQIFSLVIRLQGEKREEGEMRDAGTKMKPGPNPSLSLLLSLGGEGAEPWEGRKRRMLACDQGGGEGGPSPGSVDGPSSCSWPQFPN
jgi:hypothetical protein